MARPFYLPIFMDIGSGKMKFVAGRRWGVFWDTVCECMFLQQPRAAD